MFCILELGGLFSGHRLLFLSLLTWLGRQRLLVTFNILGGSLSSLWNLVCKGVMTLHHKGWRLEIDLLIVYFATLSILLTQNLLLKSQRFVVVLGVFVVAFGSGGGHFLDFGSFCLRILKGRVLAQSNVSVSMHQSRLRRLTFKAVFVLLKVVS